MAFLITGTGMRKDISVPINIVNSIQSGEAPDIGGDQPRKEQSNDELERRQPSTAKPLNHWLTMA